MDFNSTLASVIVPVHNRADRVTDTLESMKAQTYRPIEIIAVDDGSTDDTENVICEWIASCSANDRFRVHCEKRQPAGANAARNSGLSLSKGEYIQFFDSDDIMLPDKLEKQIGLLDGSDLDFVACDYRLCDDQEGMAVHLSSRGRTATDHALCDVLNTHAPVYRRSALDKIGPWNEKLSRWGDLEFTFRVLSNGLKGTWIKDVLYEVHDHPKNITAQADDVSYESCLRSCELMEMSAAETGISGPKFRNTIGRRLVGLSYEAASRGRREMSNRLFGEGSRRLRPIYRIGHSVLRGLRNRNSRTES